MMKNCGVWAVLAGAVLAGCVDRSQQMEEQVTSLRRELDEAQERLRASQRELAEAREKSASEPAAAGGGMPASEAVEESYMAATKELRRQIEAKLTAFTIDTCTLHNVQVAEETHPFTSAISLSLRGADGTPYQMSFPVKANAAGKWSFPETDEIVARIEGVRNDRTALASETPAPGGNPPIKAFMGADETVVIPWPEDAARAPAPSQAPPPASAAAPPARDGGAPAPVMPVSKDVLIEFE